MVGSRHHVLPAKLVHRIEKVTLEELATQAGVAGPTRSAPVRTATPAHPAEGPTQVVRVVTYQKAPR